MKFSSLLQTLPLLASTAFAQIDLDVNSRDSIIAAAKVASKNLRALYPNTESWFIPGQFGLIQTADGQNNQGYYWWEAGAAMGAWIDYWALTGDDEYNDIVTEAMLFQVGPDEDYQPPNQTLSLGNDDQAFWGIAAMAAAERGFPDPPADKPQWLALAQAVFNRQWGRWDTQYCKGGLRWQVVSTNNGYNYKNTISNGLLFHIGARLARYTGNQTYADVSEKIYKWTQDMGLLTDQYILYDGSHIPDCDVSSKIQWTYNAGVYLAGAAYLYDFYNDTTKKAQWEQETTKLLKGTEAPFYNTDSKYAVGVMQESACEFAGSGGTPTCNTDQRSFKGYLARFMGQTYQLCPFAQTDIMKKLQTSAQAAAKSCSGTVDGTSNVCGLSWRKEAYDGAPYGIAKGGVGEQMSAMEVMQQLLVGDSQTKKPVTQVSGGTSKGNAEAGTGSSDTTSDSSDDKLRPATTGDRAGAGILTTMCLGGLLGLTYWLVRE